MKYGIIECNEIIEWNINLFYEIYHYWMKYKTYWMKHNIIEWNIKIIEWNIILLNET